MASASALTAGMTAVGIVELAGSIDPPRALPVLMLSLGTDPEGHPHWGLFHLVRTRPNGFMVICAAEEDLRQALQQACLLSEEPMFSDCAVQVLTQRGRALGEAPAVLADLGWGCAGQFTPLTALRGQALKQATFLGFAVGEEKGRPHAQQALDLAAAWVLSGMAEETAQEYATAEEEDIDGDPCPTPPAASEELQERIRTLEAELAAARAQPKTALPPQRTVETYGKTPALFKANRTGSVAATEMGKLVSMAGNPPPRTGRHEQRRGLDPATIAATQDGLQAEIEKEAAEPDLAPLEDLQLGGGALSHLLVSQLQQNAILLQKLIGSKPSDPVLGALAGPDNASGSSSAGVKGCIAREAYCRATTDLTMVASAVRKNALTELGMESSREDGSVMRRYIERRIPLADHRLLCHVATLATEGWAVAFQSQNQEMLGFLGIMLMFIEQVALDQGKLQLGWLLTGLAEPNHQVHFSHRKKPGLKPFSRLANPVWVSANLAYLRDLDFMESRMEQVGKKKPGALPDADPESDKPSTKTKTPKKKNPKGKGKGNEADAKDSEA